MSSKTQIMLDSLVELSPGFKTAVNLRGDIDDNAKVAAFIPTEKACQVFSDLAENLHPLKNRRSRILTGTYGTGKSHLALVLSRIYREGTKDPSLQPIFKKLEARWPGQFKQIIQDRDELKGKFLLVLLEGDEGAFDDSLMRKLDQSLSESGLHDLVPDTVFDAAVRRIEELREKHTATYRQLEKIVSDYGFQSVKVLEELLRKKDRKTYNSFLEIHKGLLAGASFGSIGYMQPKEYFEAVSKRLTEDHGYAGIVVIWDEFGRYMERVVEDPRGAEGQSIQTFADGCCNRSSRMQVHLYLICHRSLQEYVSLASLNHGVGMSKPHQEEWTKIVGRFREYSMHSTDKEVFDLIDQVIIQKDREPGWIDFQNRTKDYFDDWTHEAVRLKLFPEFNEKEILNKVSRGSYPLHPMAAFCLPLISQRVAQNERTLFTFLSDTGSDTLGPYIHSTSVPSDGSEPPCFTADRLWDFFGMDVSRGQAEQKQIFKKWTQADLMVSPDDVLSKRILKGIALLQVIKTDKAQCKEEIVRFCLGLKQSQASELRETLKDLSSPRSDRGKVLIETLDGSYRFTGASGPTLDEKVEEAVDGRSAFFSTINVLRRISPKLQKQQEIKATRYSDDHRLERSLKIEFATCDELQSGEKLTDYTNGREFRDGTALIIICEDSSEIDKAKVLAKTVINHPQVMVGIPKAPIRVTRMLKVYDALEHLASTQANLYGTGADLRDEWEERESDYLNGIRKELDPLVEPDKGFVSWFVNGVEHDNIRSQSKLTGLVSDMMESVFPLTPVITHDRLTTDLGKDNFVSCRKAIIDKLLHPEGPKNLANETRSQDKTVIDMVYRGTGILRQSPTGYIIEQPDVAQNKPMHEVWEAIEGLVRKAHGQELKMSEIIFMLRRPPYGLRIRSIPLILAAVLRKDILRGNISIKTAVGMSVPRIDSETIEKIVLNPEQYSLVYTEISDSQVECLCGVASAFGMEKPEDIDRSELIETVRKSIVNWWHALPPFAQSTQNLSQESLVIREKVFKALTLETSDSRKVLLEVLPGFFKDKEGRIAKVKMSAWSARFIKIKLEIEQSVTTQLSQKVQDATGEVFESVGSLQDWWNSLSDERRQMRLSGDPMILAQTAQAVVLGNLTPSDAAERLAKEMTGTPLDHWKDNNVHVFKGRLEGAKRQVEVAEIAPPPPPPSPPDDFGSDCIRIVIQSKDINLAWTFVPVEELSPTGKTLKGIMDSTLTGMGRALAAGEFETILFDVLKTLQ